LIVILLILVIRVYSRIS